MSFRTGADILRKQGVDPCPTRGQGTPWADLIKSHLTMTDVGFLAKSRYLLHDRGPKYSAAFRATLRSGGVKTV